MSSARSAQGQQTRSRQEADEDQVRSKSTSIADQEPTGADDDQVRSKSTSIADQERIKADPLHCNQLRWSKIIQNCCNVSRLGKIKTLGSQGSASNNAFIGSSWPLTPHGGLAHFLLAQKSVGSIQYWSRIAGHTLELSLGKVRLATGFGVESGCNVLHPGNSGEAIRNVRLLHRAEANNIVLSKKRQGAGEKITSTGASLLNEASKSTCSQHEGTHKHKPCPC